MQATITFDLSDKRQVKALRAALDSLAGEDLGTRLLTSQPSLGMVPVRVRVGKDKDHHKSIAAWENGLLRGKPKTLSAANVRAEWPSGKNQPEDKPHKSRKGKAWSKADIAYLKANYNSMTAKQLADRLKRENPQSIYQAALRFKIVKPHLRVVA